MARRLRALPALQKAQRIALYWPMDGEIDPRSLQKISRSGRRKFFLPTLRKFPGNILVFAPWHVGKPLPRNGFGIPEPRGRRIFFARQMDVVLLPLTGFDAFGNRLGMGGGFYDRTLAFKKHSKARKPLLIGVAHACQQVNALRSEPWDVPLDLAVTDKNIFR